MGFQELESFNLALLAKQLWSILTKLETLLTSVLKDKYFKKSSILDMQVKNNASFMWKILTAAREVIQKCMKWQVGDGASIKIGSDPWVPTSSSFKFQTPTNGLQVVALVKDPFSANGKSWDINLVSKTFWDSEVEVIL